VLRLPLIANLFASLLFTGCAGQGKRARPQQQAKIDVPSLWNEASQGQHRKISTGWLSQFNDPRMTSLVREAIRKNNNLQAAAHRLKSTRESTITSRASRLPSINASGSTSRSYAGLGPAPGASGDSYGLSFSASWEIDVWGRLRDLDYATRSDYEAALADFRSAQLSLAINTAKSWVSLTESQQQLDLAEKTLVDFKKSLSLISRRQKEALLRAVDVQLGRNNVASAERNLRNRTLQRDEAARSLQLLLGRYPSGELQATSDLPLLRSSVPAGLPSELLSRRPDLAASRARIYSSALRTDAARKNLLPSLRLTGSGGTGSDQLRRALDPAYLTWSLASSIAQTIYQGGAPSAQARAALERNKAVIHDYVQSALQAFREVESALQIDRSLREQEAFLLIEVEQAGKAQAASERDLGLGIEGSSVLEILEAQRRAVNARGSLIRLRNQRIQNRLDLHLALGGDFETVLK
jgi:NodT family efflux transporter outer membrane factor (OMF) lipoprotein